jgi:hypothetical protein
MCNAVGERGHAECVVNRHEQRRVRRRCKAKLVQQGKIAFIIMDKVLFRPCYKSTSFVLRV